MFELPSVYPIEPILLLAGSAKQRDALVQQLQAHYFKLSERQVATFQPEEQELYATLRQDRANRIANFIYKVQLKADEEDNVAVVCYVFGDQNVEFAARELQLLAKRYNTEPIVAEIGATKSGLRNSFSLLEPGKLFAQLINAGINKIRTRIATLSQQSLQIIDVHRGLEQLIKIRAKTQIMQSYGQLIITLIPSFIHIEIDRIVNDTNLTFFSSLIFFLHETPTDRLNSLLGGSQRKELQEYKDNFAVLLHQNLVEVMDHLSQFQSIMGYSYLNNYLVFYSEMLVSKSQVALYNGLMSMEKGDKMSKSEQVTKEFGIDRPAIPRQRSQNHLQRRNASSNMDESSGQQNQDARSQYQTTDKQTVFHQMMDEASTSDSNVSKFKRSSHIFAHSDYYHVSQLLDAVLKIFMKSLEQPQLIMDYSINLDQLIQLNKEQLSNACRYQYTLVEVRERLSQVLKTSDLYINIVNIVKQSVVYTMFSVVLQCYWSVEYYLNNRIDVLREQTTPFAKIMQELFLLQEESTKSIFYDNVALNNSLQLCLTEESFEHSLELYQNFTQQIPFISPINPMEQKFVPNFNFLFQSMMRLNHLINDSNVVFNVDRLLNLLQQFHVNKGVASIPNVFETLIIKQFEILLIAEKIDHQDQTCEQFLSLYEFASYQDHIYQLANLSLKSTFSERQRVSWSLIRQIENSVPDEKQKELLKNLYLLVFGIKTEQFMFIMDISFNNFSALFLKSAYEQFVKQSLLQFCTQEQICYLKIFARFLSSMLPADQAVLSPDLLEKFDQVVVSQLPHVQIQDFVLKKQLFYFDDSVEVGLLIKTQLTCQNVTVKEITFNVLGSLSKQITLQFDIPVISDSFTDFNFQLGKQLLEFQQDFLTIKLSKLLFCLEDTNFTINYTLNSRGLAFKCFHPFSKIVINESLPQTMYIGGLYNFKLQPVNQPSGTIYEVHIEQSGQNIFEVQRVNDQMPSVNNRFIFQIDSNCSFALRFINETQITVKIFALSKNCQNYKKLVTTISRQVISPFSYKLSSFPESHIIQAKFVLHDPNIQLYASSQFMKALPISEQISRVKNIVFQYSKVNQKQDEFQQSLNQISNELSLKSVPGHDQPKYILIQFVINEVQGAYFLKLDDNIMKMKNQIDQNQLIIHDPSILLDVNEHLSGRTINTPHQVVYSMTPKVSGKYFISFQQRDDYIVFVGQQRFMLYLSKDATFKVSYRCILTRPGLRQLHSLVLYDFEDDKVLYQYDSSSFITQ